MAGAPAVRRLIRIGRIESLFLFEIKSCPNINIEKICNKFTMHRSTAIRIIYALERKNKVVVQDETIHLKEQNTNEFKTTEDIARYYDYLQKIRVFDLKKDCIEITADFIFYHLLDEEFSMNQSLVELKTSNRSRYDQVVTGLVEQLNYMIKTMKKRMFSWSEGKYELFIDIYKISIVRAGTSRPVNFRIDNSQKFKDLKLLAECSFMFKNSLEELYDKIKSIAYLDYSQL